MYIDEENEQRKWPTCAVLRNSHADITLLPGEQLNLKLDIGDVSKTKSGGTSCLEEDKFYYLPSNHRLLLVKYPVF